MSLFSKKKILVTHDGTFHADDLFATAALSILNNGNVKIIRSRNQKIINKGDYVYDVGGIYDPEINRFDHHQKGGAGKRENGIPYASFGLVWRTYGEKICKSKEIGDIIDKKIAQPIDAIDNGVDLVNSIFKYIMPYGADQVFLSNIPTWKESNEDIDKIFKKQVKKIIELLKREIEVARVDIEGRDLILKAYKNSKDKRIIIVDIDFPRYLFQDTLSKLPEPLYFIYPSSHSNGWKVEAIKKSPETMESRKYFPESWRGIMENSGKLKEVTGVFDAEFCHASGFFLTVGSKEGAVALANKALLA